MATVLQTPLSDYLGITYRPDREYVDGEIRERNVGKWEHARVQALSGRLVLRTRKGMGNHRQHRTTGTGRTGRVRVPDLVCSPLAPSRMF